MLRDSLVMAKILLVQSCDTQERDGFIEREKPLYLP